LYISYIDYENENADAYFPDFDEKKWIKIEEKKYENWKFVIYKIK
jgi:dihydrofolate reductase